MADHSANPPGKALGKGMLIAAWLILMAMLTWYFAGVEERQDNPNINLVTGSGEGFTEVVLKRNRWGHYVAPGEINGRAVVFMVDTGATMVAIPRHLGAGLGLKEGRGQPVSTANGTTTAYTTTIAELRLGELVFSDVRGGLTEGMEGDQILLGMSVLAGLSLIQHGDELMIRQPR